MWLDGCTYGLRRFVGVTRFILGLDSLVGVLPDRWLEPLPETEMGELLPPTGSSVMLLSFFFLLLTKVVKWVVGIRAVFWPWVLNQEDSRAAPLVTLWAGLTWRIHCMRSLASLDTLAKYSSGKLKSPRIILLLVSSKESSRNGERPLKRKINKVLVKKEEEMF